MKFRLKGASGHITGQPFDLSATTRIGSGDDADIRLPELAAHHARIDYDGQRLTLSSDAEVWINGEPARQQRLKSGDELRLGPYRFVLQAPGLRPPTVLERTPQRRVSAWTWVAIAAAATAGAAGAVLTLIMRGGFG